MTTTAATPATTTWNLDPAHSGAEFKVKHMMISNGKGSFSGLSGVLAEHATDSALSSVEASVDVATVNTGDEKRDGHLKSADFFDAEKFPEITFKSTAVELAGEGKHSVSGDLTIHGVTKEAILDVDGPTPAMKDPKGTSHRGASATTTINRTDYGMNTMTGMIGDSVTIQLDVELIDHAPGGPPPAK